MFFYILNIIQQRVYAQDPAVDSLNNVLKSANNDTTRIVVLSNLSEICEIKNVLFYAESAKKICEQALKNGNLKPELKLFYNKYLSLAYYNIGFYESNNDNVTKALYNYKISIEISEKINDIDGIANAYNNIGLIYDNIGDIIKALDYLHKSLKLREVLKDDSGIATVLNNIGSLYY